MYLQWVLDYPNSNHSNARLFKRLDEALFSAAAETTTFQSLELCYRRKQSCCMNDFSQMLHAFFSQYGI